MKSHATWALVGASVVLLGFTSLQHTDAAWSDSDSTASGTVRTGHLSITGAGSMDLDVSGLTRESMNTGDTVQVPLAVHNDSTIPVDYRLTGVVALAGTTPPALDLRVARAAIEPCLTAGTPGTTGVPLYVGGITDASTSAHTLAPGGSDVLCLTTTAQPVSPGQSGRYVFTFRAEQR